MKVEKIKGLCKDCKYFRPHGFDIKLENGSLYHLGICVVFIVNAKIVFTRVEDSGIGSLLRLKPHHMAILQGG